ncbi:hypothetical protein Tco_0349565, partial [Tanacetum coccineum]
GRGGGGNEGGGSGIGGIGKASGSGIGDNGRGRGGSGGKGGGTSSMGGGRSRRGGGIASSGGRRGGGRGSRGVGSTEVVGWLEQAIEQAKIDAEQERLDKERREEQEWEENQDYFNLAMWREDLIEEAPFNQQFAEDTTVTTEDIDEAPVMKTSETTKLGEGKASTMVEDVSAPAMDKGKGKESVVDEASAPNSKKRGRPPSRVNDIRIYHKNHRRSERISNMKKKPFQFEKHGTGSTPDKAFDVDDEEQTNPQDSTRTTSAVDLEEFCEKRYEKLLPIMVDKYEYEKRKKEKMEEVKVRLDFGDTRKKSTRA